MRRRKSMKHRKLIGLSSLLLASMLMIQPVLAEAAVTAEVNSEAAEAASTSYKLEAKTFPYISQYTIDEEPEESEITLYFVNGGEIPYAALNDYMSRLTDLMDDTGKLVYNVEANSDTQFSVIRDDNGSGLFIDTEEDTLFFLNMNGFESAVGSKAAVSVKDLPEAEPIDIDVLAETEIKRMELHEDSSEESKDQPMQTMESDSEMAGNETVTPNLFASGSVNGVYYNRAGSPVELDLSEYMIDLISVDGECYLPFQTLNDLFITSLSVHVVFNGEKVLCFSNGMPISKQRFEVPAGSFSKELAQFNYNELLFLLNTFYGLKPEHNIKDFGELMEVNTDLAMDLAGTDPHKFDLALMQLLGIYLDDGHSGFIGNSILSGETSGRKTQVLSSLLAGTSTRTSFQLGAMYLNAREAVLGEDVPGYEEVGDTAFITFDSFLQYREDEAYYDPQLTFEDPEDTIELIIYANRQIKRENSPVKKIVLDLSNNSGGHATAAIFVISWFLGNAQIALYDTLTGAETNAIYQCDVDLDGTYNQQKDTVSQGYKLYCLTSHSSFSCGNLVPAACKNSGIVTLIGQPSGGGSCVVTPCTTASGALFRISGHKQLSIVKNGSFYNIDQGIEPDFVLSKPESFYDRAALVEYLNELK